MAKEGKGDGELHVHTGKMRHRKIYYRLR
jgi:hypothetical protein